MDSTVTPLSQMLQSLHEDIFNAVEPLSDAEINWSHPHLSNTIGILLRHIAGSERYWIGQVVGGRRVTRDRDAEFVRERLRKAPLVENLRNAHNDVQEVLRSLSTADLAAPIAVEWRGGTQRFLRMWAIVHAVEHTSYHLGQIQLFKKMATAAATNRTGA
jgi:uncharacterized damage-inducible protein DinB